MGQTKTEKYQLAISQIKGLLEDEADMVANLSNIAAVLKAHFSFWWVGFYFVRGEELVLGPFQGPVACTRIGYGKGVCGTAWERKETVIVPDVHEFPGHIACNALSRSEIVVPVLNDNKVTMVLDVDSEHPDHFDETDRQFLEEIASMIPQKQAAL